MTLYRFAISCLAFAFLGACQPTENMIETGPSRTYAGATLVETVIEGHKARVRRNGSEATVELEGVARVSGADQTRLALTAARNVTRCNASYRPGTLLDNRIAGASSVTVPVSLSC